MNILLINHYAGSPDMGMEFRPYYLAREWVKMGHHIRIAAGDYSHLRLKNPVVHRDFQREEIDGIDYYWLRTGDYKGNGLRRAFTMLRFVGKLWLKAGMIAREWKPDVVIASSTYPLDTYAAQRIARMSGARLIHEVHDMWPATLYEIGGMSKYNPFVMLVQLAENTAYRHSDYIVSLLPLARDYMVKHGMKPKKFIHIPNGIVDNEWKCIEPLPDEHRAFLVERKNAGNFIVGYFGGHGNSNALNVLLEVAKQTPDSSIIFVLIGSGTEKERLMRQKNNEFINNLFFLPSISKKSIPDLVSYLDCIYIGSKNSPLYRFGVCMNKIFDSMMSGKPVICSITAPEVPISQYKCGYVVDSEDTDKIIKAITDIKGLSEQERNAMGLNGRIAVLQNFTYEKLAKKFATLF